MEIDLKRETINCMSTLLRADTSKEETQEVIVPDALPDIVRILDTKATAFIKSKEADEGRLTVTGTSEVCVLYVPDGAQCVRKMKAEVPFSLCIENPQITKNTSSSVRLSVRAADARTLNPRKLMIRTEVCMSARCHTASPLLMTVAAGKEAETLTGELTFPTVCGCGEKTFIMSDEYKIAGSKPAIAEILFFDAELICEDVQSIGGRAAVKGRGDITAVYRSTADSVETVTYSTPFSQIVDVKSEDAATSFLTDTVLCGIYIDTECDRNGEERTILCEIHAVTQCTACCEKTVRYVCDAYSTNAAYEVRKTGERITEICPEYTEETGVKKTVGTPSEVKSVLCVTCSAANERVETDGGKKTAKADVTVCAVYKTEDGRILSGEGRLTASSEIRGEGEFCVKAAVRGDVRTDIVPGGIDVSVPVHFDIRCARTHVLENVSQMSIDEKAPKTADAPSAVLVRVSEKDTLWSLAKENGSTTELIEKANRSEENGVLIPGKMLLIPRKRRA